MTLPKAWSDHIKSAIELLEAKGIKVQVVWSDSGLEKRCLIEHLQGKQAHMMSLDVLDKEVIESCPDLKVIAKHGIGVDNIDIHTATKYGIPVCNTPGSNSHAVADLTMGLMISICRKITEANELVRQAQMTQMMGLELQNKVLGILGFGAIGKQVAIRAKGFGLSIYAYDKYIDQQFCDDQKITVANFEQIISQSDFLTVHLPLNLETAKIINEQAIKMMKKGALLVNVSRGGIVDEDACAKALMNGHLAGAAFDVFLNEPPDINGLLFKAPNTLFSTHMAGCTQESIARSAFMAAQNIVDVLSGRIPHSVVNRDFKDSIGYRNIVQ